MNSRFKYLIDRLSRIRSGSYDDPILRGVRKMEFAKHYSRRTAMNSRGTSVSRSPTRHLIICRKSEYNIHGRCAHVHCLCITYMLILLNISSPLVVRDISFVHFGNVFGIGVGIIIRMVIII